jgi:hypothetical protein
MRPTELQFRSPKEKTAEFNMPVVTKEGTVLLPTVCKNKHQTFSKGKRFPQYEEYAKKTGYRVAPGSYSLDITAIGKAHVRGTHVYRGFHGQKDVTNNGYILVGNQMMFDGSFVLPSKKSPGHEVDKSVITGSPKANLSFYKPSTASTPSKHRRSISTKPRITSPSLTSYKKSVNIN